MDCRSNYENQNLASTSSKMKLEYEDEQQEQDESSNIEVEEDTAMCDPTDDSIVGSDKTSADYYFDSYSHFGNLSLKLSHFSSLISSPLL